jgi:hypothetical protein
VIGHKVDRSLTFTIAQRWRVGCPPEPNFIQAVPVLENRVHPERLTEEINGLLDTA